MRRSSVRCDESQLGCDVSQLGPHSLIRVRCSSIGSASAEWKHITPALSQVSNLIVGKDENDLIVKFMSMMMESFCVL